ncbi:hypothetical protein Tco_0501138, partial [Tanacetum coccineum]
IPPIALGAGETVVASPAGMLDMVIHSSTDFDSSDDSSSEHAPIAPSTSPFIFTYDSSETSEDHFNNDSSSSLFSLSSSSTYAPPALRQILHAPPGLPR